jgi:diguanylate cyclase (GGDEF)-like protein
MVVKVYDNKSIDCWLQNIEYVQKSVREIGILIALFTVGHTIIDQSPAGAWITMLATGYVVANILMIEAGIVFHYAEVVVNCLLCMGLTYFGGAFSGSLYYIIVINVVFSLGRTKAFPASLVAGVAYLVATYMGIESLKKLNVFELLYYIVGLFIVVKGSIYIRELVMMQESSEQKIQQLKIANDYNYSLAITDSLTGLYNYRAYKEKIEFLTQYVLLVIDIDHFKKINDTYGHSFGNKILVTLADIMKQNVRNDDWACRYGGEEFVIVLPNATYEVGMNIAERLRVQVADTQFYCEKILVSATVSIGITEKRKELGSTATFEQADCAMYRAKQQGRNNVQVFHSQWNEISCL